MEILIYIFVGLGILRIFVLIDAESGFIDEEYITKWKKRLK